MATTALSPEGRAEQINRFIKALVSRNGIMPAGVKFTMGLMVDAFDQRERQTLEEALSQLSRAEHIIDEMKEHATHLKMLLETLIERIGDEIEVDSPAHQMLSAVDDLQPRASLPNLVKGGRIEGSELQINQTGVDLERRGLIKRHPMGSTIYFAVTSDGRDELEALNRKKALQESDANLATLDRA